MEETWFNLMHKDNPVCRVSIEAVSGAMLRVEKPEHPELLPPGGCVDANTLRKWWQRRAVPISQGRIREILERSGLCSPQSYLVRNLGLSLTDHYWIRPSGMELGWEDVSLFTNDFQDAAGEFQIEDSEESLEKVPGQSFTPSSATQGELRKMWEVRDGVRYLVKGSHGGNAQECLNEVAATLLHEQQNAQPYVPYSPILYGQSQQLCCICACFTSEDVELIPAIDVVETRKKSNSVSLFEHFIQVCADHGLPETVTRPFLEYQILTDFVLTNTDRHLNNFGVLRDSNTLKYVGMAPIFDSGNSMFWQNPTLPRHSDLQDIEVNSFRRTERQLLSLVTNPGIVDLEKLPSVDALREIYSAEPLIPCLDAILLGYTKKVELLANLK